MFLEGNKWEKFVFCMLTAKIILLNVLLRIYQGKQKGK